MVGTYILKHKDYNTALIKMDLETGEFYGVDVLSPKDMPVLGDEQGRLLHAWFDSRAIPNERAELEQILRKAGCQTSQEYLVKNFALSLTDTYWICPASLTDLTWSQVNLFSHTGKVMEFHDGNGREYYTSSNASLTGSLPKRAVYKNDGWYLQKQDSGKSGEGLQNVNEAFASLMHRRQGFSEYVNYQLHFERSGISDYCECKYFTDERHEFISAYDVTGEYKSMPYRGAEAIKQFVDLCEENGLDRQYVTDFLDYQTLTDFLITNTDRHWGNFGILRDPDTLHFLSLAPIFDSGTSMVCNDPYVRNRISLLRIETNGVEKLQQDQLSLVKNTSLIDLDAVPSAQETKDFYIKNGVNEEHAEQIAMCYGFKLDMLLELQHGFSISIANEMENAGCPPYVHGQPNPEFRK